MLGIPVLLGIPMALAAAGFSSIPELAYLVVAQGESIYNSPIGEGVRFNSELNNVYISMDFAEDVQGRVLETRLYFLGQASEQPARISVGAAWQPGTIHQTNTFIKPTNLANWPDGKYEVRTYVDDKLLKVAYYELAKDAPAVPKVPREDKAPVLNLGAGQAQ